MPDIKIFKFGGASVKDAEAVKNVGNIITHYKGDDNLVVIVSAMGKTTNALEVLVKLGFNKQEFEEEWKALKEFHLNIIEGLFANKTDIVKEIDQVFEEIRIILHTFNSNEFNYLYDQIVSLGEILSTKIIAAYCNSVGVNAEFKDARGLIKTDNTYREGKVNWNVTEYLIHQSIDPIFTGEAGASKVVITQGFIGQSTEGNTTTLGREGSDYTASIFAYSLNAVEVTIWKDVAGVLNADPKYFDDAQILNQLSYTDAIELAYYGATVIHPKTIKPLENKKIPLRVKSFVNPAGTGTVISQKESLSALPTFIFKVNQALVSISPKDFSFMVEENLSDIFGMLAKYRINVNLMQHSALSFQVCVDNDIDKVSQLYVELEKSFNLQLEENLELITVRNYNQSTVDRLLAGKKLLVEQKNSHTVRLVVRSAGS
jgi:aspartate kinase